MIHDKEAILTGKKVLIVDDDMRNVFSLKKVLENKEMEVLVGKNGKEGLTNLNNNPDVNLILMDIMMPEMDGYEAMGEIRKQERFKDLPIIALTAKAMKGDRAKCIEAGASDYLTKPVSPEALEQVYDKLNKMISKSVKDLLVVEDNTDQAEAIAKIIGNGDVRITVASTVGEAYDLVLSGKYDCMVLDLGLSDMSGVELLDKIRNNEDVSRLPIIIYTGRELTEQQRKIIDKYADSTIIKGAGSQQKLLDDTTLFLHRVETNLSEEQQKMIRMIHDKEAILTGKKVLVVDDDMRNVFSLKKVLEDKGMEVLVGKNGKEGLKRLNDNPEINLVLMDIMMPEMDGYEAMEEIRKQEQFKGLPIIALTAKAMKGDRAKCIEAGASDYMTKPVDTDRLFSVLRVWLYK